MSFRAPRAELADQIRHGRGRRANDGELRYCGQTGHRWVDLNARQYIMLRVDGHDRSREASFNEILQHRRSDAAGLLRCANHCDGLRSEEVLEI